MIILGIIRTAPLWLAVIVKLGFIVVINQNYQLATVRLCQAVKYNRLS